MVRRDKIRMWSKRLTASACSPWRWIERVLCAVLAFKTLLEIFILAYIGIVLVIAVVLTLLGVVVTPLSSLLPALAVCVASCVRVLGFQVALRLMRKVRSLCYLFRAIKLTKAIRRELKTSEVDWRLILSLIDVDGPPVVSHRGAYEDLAYLMLVTRIDLETFSPEERTEVSEALAGIHARFSRPDLPLLRLSGSRARAMGKNDREDVVDFAHRYDRRRTHDEDQARGYREAGIRADPDGGTRAGSSAGVIMLVIVETVDARKERA